MSTAGLESLQILVVDDNRQMRLLLRSLLRGFGFRRTFEAADAAEALDIMKSTVIDIVLVDWNMAPISGEEFAQMIRTSKDSPNPLCTVIMVTGHSERSRVARARDAGVNSFLVKPVSAEALRKHLVAAFTDNRPFVRSGRFVGPCRRCRGVVGYKGPLRRSTDGDIETDDDHLDVDEVWKR
ncbi:MAG: response regulator [Caulobacterales bacterium]